MVKKVLKISIFFQLCLKVICKRIIIIDKENIHQKEFILNLSFHKKQQFLMQNLLGNKIVQNISHYAFKRAKYRILK